LYEILFQRATIDKRSTICIMIYESASL